MNAVRMAENNPAWMPTYESRLRINFQRTHEYEEGIDVLIMTLDFLFVVSVKDV